MPGPTPSRIFPGRWHPLVSDALAIHHQQAASFTETSTSAVQAAIADFIDFVITDAGKTAEGGGLQDAPR